MIEALLIEAENELAKAEAKCVMLSAQLAAANKAYVSVMASNAGCAAPEEPKKYTPRVLPEDAAPTETEKSNTVTYADVKKVILEIAKAKGRDASLDVLAAFGVVKGEGKERTGNISSLTEDQYADVVGAAKKALS